MILALIGCGAIGRAIAKAVQEGVIKGSVCCLYDIKERRCREVAAILDSEPRICRDVKELLKSEAELVVEAASQEAVREYAQKILEAGKSILVMSVGALLDKKVYDNLINTAEAHKAKVYVPSGAIGGLDALKAAGLGKISEVKLTTTKHPRALVGAPFLERKGNIKGIKKRVVIYKGSASEAVKEFPANINVSAALSLAGVGARETKVEIIADPGVKQNIHEITAKGDFGSFALRFENLPSPKNPRTSYLAALSAIATLKKLSSPVEIGT